MCKQQTYEAFTDPEKIVDLEVELFAPKEDSAANE